MKIKSILFATCITYSLFTQSQTLNDMWNTTKQTANDAAKEAAKQAEKQAQEQINAAKKKAAGVVNGSNTSVTKPSLTNDEVIKGLKEALSVGTNNSSGTAAKLDGYLKTLCYLFLGQQKPQQ